MLGRRPSIGSITGVVTSRVNASSGGFDKVKIFYFPRINEPCLRTKTCSSVACSEFYGPRTRFDGIFFDKQGKNELLSCVEAGKMSGISIFQV
jgi:hypothetical protein